MDEVRTLALCKLYRERDGIISHVLECKCMAQNE